MKPADTGAATDRGLRRDVAVLTATAMWLAAGAACGLLPTVRAAYPVAPRLHGTATDFLSITVHNLAVCSAMVLVTHLPAVERRWIGNSLDVLAALILFPASFLAGVIALQPGGVALLPHAPLELAGVSLAASWWWRHRGRPPRRRASLNRLAVVAACLSTAAAIEAFCTPHV